MITHVFGQGARAYRDEHYPDAAIWDEPTLNPKVGAPGSIEQPRTILVLPGEYDRLDGFLGKRANVEVTGLDGDRSAVFKNTDIAGDYAERLTVSNLTLKNSAVKLAHWHESGRQVLTIRNNKFCEWTQNKNGVVNPNGQTDAEQMTYLLNNVFDGVGSPDNTKHAVYLEGRPHAGLMARGNTFSGAKRCSQIKTTFADNHIEDNTFGTRDSTGEWLANSMIDVPACSDTRIIGNRFDVWAVDGPRKGLFTAPIFFRDRKPGMFGADMPPYGSTEFWSDTLWRKVTQFYNEFESPTYLFQKFIYRNLFTLAPGSVPMAWMRDDGTYPMEAVQQLQTGARAKAVPPGWIERSMTHYAENTFSGTFLPPQLDRSEFVALIEAGAQWPRSLPTHFPRAREVVPVTTIAYPQWFLDAVE